MTELVQPLAEAQAENVHSYLEQFGYGVVPEFVNKNQHPKDKSK